MPSQYVQSGLRPPKKLCELLSQNSTHLQRHEMGSALSEAVQNQTSEEMPSRDKYPEQIEVYHEC